MLKNVTAMSRDRASRLKAKDLSVRPTAIISIGSKYTRFTELSGAFAKILRTNFEFIDGAFRRPDDGGPTPAQIEEILEFIRDLASDSEDYDLIIHCGEGRFRSVAVATFIDLNYDGVVASAAEDGISIGGGSVSLFRDLAIAYDERHA